MLSMKRDLEHTLLNVKIEMLKHLRKRRLIVMILISAVMPLLYYVLPRLMGREIPDDSASILSMNLGFVNMLIIIAASVLIGDSISGEFQTKTGLLLFPTPQRRVGIYLGKVIAGMIATSVVILVYYVVTATEIYLVYGAGSIRAEMLTSLMISFLYGISVISFVFFLSSIVKRSITAILAGILTLFMVLPIIGKVLEGVDVEPWFLVTYSAGLITDVMDLGNDIGFGPGHHMASSAFEPDLALGIVVMALYATAFLLLGITAGARRSME